MRTDSLIALKIGQDETSIAAALKPVLGRAAAVISGALTAIDNDQVRLELAGRVQALQEIIDGSTDVATLTASCFELCERALQTLQAQEHERRAELRRLVAMVRDTVALLADGGEGFSNDISQAASRFNALARINDVHLLKQRLLAEVGDLQRVAASRREQWKQTVEMFEARIVTLEKQLEAVQQEAAVDPVTGIANRRHFEQTLRETLQSEREFVVAMLDLDDFKAVNDTGGHAAGDAVLQAVAQMLKSSLRKNDLVARIGGDEFAILGTQVTLRAAEPRIRSIVASLGTIPTRLDSPAHVSVSCGLAEYCAGDSAESLVRRADQALYEAKRHGKNRVVSKSPPFIRDLLHKKV